MAVWALATGLITSLTYLLWNLAGAPTSFSDLRVLPLLGIFLVALEVVFIPFCFMISTCL